jgi:hypothetical protein
MVVKRLIAEGQLGAPLQPGTVLDALVAAKAGRIDLSAFRGIDRKSEFLQLERHKRAVEGAIHRPAHLLAWAGMLAAHDIAKRKEHQLRHRKLVTRRPNTPHEIALVPVLWKFGRESDQRLYKAWTQHRKYVGLWRYWREGGRSGGVPRRC